MTTCGAACDAKLTSLRLSVFHECISSALNPSVSTNHLTFCGYEMWFSKKNFPYSHIKARKSIELFLLYWLYWNIFDIRISWDTYLCKVVRRSHYGIWTGRPDWDQMHLISWRKVWSYSLTRIQCNYCIIIASFVYIHRDESKPYQQPQCAHQPT